MRAGERDEARETTRKEAIEAISLALVGIGGLVALGATFAPAPVVAAVAPEIASPASGWPVPAAHAEPVVRYVLQAKLDPAEHTIDGKGTMSLTNVATAPLSELRLHLYLNAFKNDRTVFRRARVGGFRGDTTGAFGYVDVKRLAWNGEDLWAKRVFPSSIGATPQDPLRPGDAPAVEGAADDETDVRIPLPKPVSPGETITLDVEFQDKLPEVSERTGYHGSFHFAGQWFPKFAKLERDGTFASFPFHHLAEFYADYGSYDVTLDVPEAFTLGACGPLVSSKVEGGRRIERHVLDDVHDFAWTAWDRFVVRETTIEGLAVRALFPPGYASVMDSELEALTHAIRDKNARFGAYPYSLITVVHPPDDAMEAGGMEYPTLITTGGPWWLPMLGVHESEGTAIHEFGHQWFYGLVATHEVEWPAGDEGFNSYGDAVADTRIFGAGSGISLGPISLDWMNINGRGVVGALDEPIFQPAYRFATGRSYGGRVYGATASMLVTLRNVFGPDAFDRAIGVYARKFRYRNPKPDDFFAVLDEHCGAECATAARTAFTGAFRYDVSIERISSEKEKSPAGYFDPPAGRVKKEPTDTGRFANAVWVVRQGTLDLPVDVELRFENGTRARHTIRFADGDGRAGTSHWHRIDADGPVGLTSAIVDPDRKILVDRDRLDNVASTPKGRGGAPITRERALAWMGVLLRGVGP